MFACQQEIKQKIAFKNSNEKREIKTGIVITFLDLFLSGSESYYIDYFWWIIVLFQKLRKSYSEANTAQFLNADKNNSTGYSKRWLS